MTSNVVTLKDVFSLRFSALTLWTDLNETVLPSADILFSSGRRVFDAVTVNRINMNENFSSLLIFDTNAESTVKRGDIVEMTFNMTTVLDTV